MSTEEIVCSTMCVSHLLVFVCEVLCTLQIVTKLSIENSGPCLLHVICAICDTSRDSERHIS